MHEVVEVWSFLGDFDHWGLSCLVRGNFVGTAGLGKCLVGYYKHLFHARLCWVEGGAGLPLLHGEVPVSRVVTAEELRLADWELLFEGVEFQTAER